MRKRRVSFQHVNIETVIKARLNFQTTQNTLFRDYKIKDSSFQNIISKTLLDQIKLWDSEKRKNFFILVGGLNYLKLTQDYFHGLQSK